MSEHDLVTWPQYAPTGCEDGMAVYAFWPVTDQTPTSSYIETAAVTVGEVLVRSNPAQDLDAVFPRYREHVMDGCRFERSDLTSVELMAFLTFAVTPEVYFEPDDSGYWHATREDLTPAGRSVLETLDALYGQPAVLLTVLST